MPSDSPNRSEARRLAVGAEIEGQRIDKALVASFPDLSRSRIHGLIESGDVLLNGSHTKASAKVRAGDVLSLSVPAAIPSDLQPEKGDLRILFEDESLLVVSKAAGVVVHPGAGTTSGTLAAALLEHCGTLSQIGGVTRPGIVHRLDKGTSGLMVVAKNDHAHRALSAQFKARSVTKIYSAIAFGVPKPSRGAVRLPIGRDPGNRKRMAVVVGGREAWTDYETLELLGLASSIRLTLHSGRTHQIRVHMASLKCPLVGDHTYGASAFASKAPAAAREIVSQFDRPALHAQVLGFQHPSSGEALRFEEPWPEDMTRLREGLIGAQKKG